MEQWTLIKTVTAQIKMLKNPPKPVQNIQEKLLSKSTKWTKSTPYNEKTKTHKLTITQHQQNPIFPEMETLRYAAFCYNMDIIKQTTTKEDANNEPTTTTQYGILPHHQNKPLIDQDDMTSYMEQQAQNKRNTETNKLPNKLKGRIIDTHATNAYTKSKNLYKSWVRHLWAQRTGALNYQGAKTITDNYTTCPLCKQHIKTGITWHALLDCTHQDIQTLYEKWASTSTKHWNELIDKLSTEDTNKLLTPKSINKLRGTTNRGNKWGGWIHELGDISPTQHLIIAAAHPKKALDYIFKAQKALTHHNTTILNKYTQLTGMHKGPDNGIRIATKLKPTQEQDKQEQTQPTPSNTPITKTNNKTPTFNPHKEEEQKYHTITQTWKYYGYGQTMTQQEKQYYTQLKAQQHKEGNSSSNSRAHAPTTTAPHTKQQPAIRLTPLELSPFLKTFGNQPRLASQTKKQQTSIQKPTPPPKTQHNHTTRTTTYPKPSNQNTQPKNNHTPKRTHPTTTTSKTSNQHKKQETSTHKNQQEDQQNTNSSHQRQQDTSTYKNQQENQQETSTCIEMAKYKTHNTQTTRTETKQDEQNKKHTSTHTSKNKPTTCITTITTNKTPTTQPHQQDAKHTDEHPNHNTHTAAATTTTHPTNPTQQQDNRRRLHRSSNRHE